MEHLNDPNIYVAPLQIKKETSPVEAQAIESSERPSDCTYQQDTPEHWDFQSYLRAFYPFHPKCDTDSSTVTLPLNRGDVILIHSVHTNGWADGTLLSSGARGWLPTNYCEAYDNHPVRNLLKALTTFWDIVRSANSGALEIFGSQDYVRGLVAGVRCLLDRTHCLSRDSSTLRSHRGLRWNRKALICDVSSLVKTAKELQAAVEKDSAIQVEGRILDELIMKAFKTVTRAVRFLDIWAEDILSPQSTDNRIDHDAQSPESDRAPAKSSINGTTDERLHDKLEDTSATTNHNELANNNDINGDVYEQTIVRPSYGRASHTYIRPNIPNEEQNYQQSSAVSHRQSVSHRVSCSVGNAPLANVSLISTRLNATHDVFLGSLGSFIGLHLESRSSSDLLLTTKQAVISCRDMLKVIEAILERDAQRSISLAEAREDMYGNITALAEAARRLFRPTASGELDELHLLDAQKPMVDAATACVRTAGDCVAESQLVLERLGDFSFEPLSLGLSRFDKDGHPASDAGTSFDSEPADSPATCQDQHIALQEPPDRPPPPPLEPAKPETSLSLTIPTTVGSSSPPKQVTVENIIATTDLTVQPLLPPLPPFAGLLSPSDDVPPSPQFSVGSSSETHSNQERRLRTDSFDVSSATGSCTLIGSARDSEMSEVSESSTRATSPDATYISSLAVSPQYESLAQSRSTLNDDVEEAECVVQQKTFAHETVFNKDGQISGGTLPALIERLTTHHSTPDAMFVATFYLTFRLFATPREFAQALIDRFSYVGENIRIAGPVRLRVYNVFKGWLESHWRNDCDGTALELIISFATRQLQLVLPTAGKRLACLAEKVNAVEGPLVPRLVSSIGKTNTCIAAYVSPDTPLPAPIITKSQAAALRNWKHTGASISILDFDPLELARQFTLKASRVFCSILPEELLATEWTKKSGSMAINVRAMSTLSTDLANLVADSILQRDDPKKRALVVKQWVKIAKRCLELANYDSLMAIICSLNSSTILRLKRTWEIVSTKTKATLENLKTVVDCSRNYAALRQRLQTTIPPCLPFVGTYLTDLTFVDVGNQTTRQLPGEGAGESLSVINFDKHIKTARIISELQRFQIPYRFTEIPELQTWMQDQLVRVRSSDQSNVQSYYRRSLLLEPREQTSQKSPSIDSHPTNFSEKFEMFLWPHTKTGNNWTNPATPS